MRVFLAGGVPEVMLHLRRLGVLRGEALTISGRTWDACSTSGRRASAGTRCGPAREDGVDPDDVICPPDRARREGHDVDRVLPRRQPGAHRQRHQEHRDRPRILDADGIYRKVGPARVFTSERDAIAAIKGTTAGRSSPGT